MIKHILLEGDVIDEIGTLSLQVNREIEINILAEEARRRVNYFVRMDISTQMHGKKPMLVIADEGDEVMWRVPVHLTFPDFGDVGCVGFLFVDPITGDIDTSSTTVQTLKKNANHLAQRFKSTSTHTG